MIANLLDSKEYSLCKVDNLDQNYHIIQADQFAVKYRINNTDVKGGACKDHEKHVGNIGIYDLCHTYDQSTNGDIESPCVKERIETNDKYKYRVKTEYRIK